MTWSEGKIGRILARNTFANAVCALPNCTWTGDEVDLLVIPPCLRVIDVEIKITRADLRADAKKSKWWRRPRRRGDAALTWEPVQWPRQVWKHYYAMPAEMWREELGDVISNVSGVLLVSEAGGPRGLHGYAAGRVQCVRRALPNREAQPVGAKAMQQIARLASLRMWDAYRAVEDKRKEL